jgi:hypothetical protein
MSRGILAGNADETYAPALACAPMVGGSRFPLPRTSPEQSLHLVSALATDTTKKIGQAAKNFIDNRGKPAYK